MSNVLLITVGDTPQVVTETVHALLTAEPPWVPARIILATTGFAERRFRTWVDDRGSRRAPLTGPDGKLRALYAELKRDADYVEPELLVLGDADGRFVDDLQSEADVNGFATLLLNVVIAITDDPATRLHLSLAGGRKTMSFLAGQVMNMYGRSQDEMSHVIVRPTKFEKSDLWWPGQEAPVKGQSGALDASEAKALLHKVPFIRARAWLDFHRKLPARPADYAEAVHRTNAGLAADQVTLDCTTCTVIAGAERVALDPIHFAAIMMHAAARKMGASLQHRNEVPNLDGDAHRAADLWPWAYGAVMLNSWFEEPDMVISGEQFLATARPRAQKLESPDFRSYESKAKARLQEAVPGLAVRLMAKRGSTPIPADRITIMLPEPLVGLGAPWEPSEAAPGR